MKTKSGEKEKLRERIIDQSIKVIKKKGILGASVDTIMQSLGLTSGALYSHFSGKDELLALSLEKQIDLLTEYVTNLITSDTKEGFKHWVSYYLSEEHVRDITNGCVFAALLSEVSRAPQTIKTRFHVGLDKFYLGLEKGLPSHLKQKRKTVQSIFSLMVGSLSIARTIKSASDREEFLTNTKASVYQMLAV